MADSDAEFVDAESSELPISTLKEAMPSPSIKRKGSPITFPEMKRQNSLPNLTNIANLASTTKKQSLAELFVNALKEPTFQKDAAPALADLINPFVESAIAKLTTHITTLTETTQKLHETVEKQCELLQAKQSVIDNQQTQLDDQSSEIATLKTQVQDLSENLFDQKLKNNDLEQYGRRNSLRFIQLKTDTSLDEEHLTKFVVSYINKNILPSDPISTTEVERCHPVSRGETPQILIKFKSYHTKNKVFKAKKQLKGNHDKTFITEDLTQFNHNIIKSLLKLHGTKEIVNFWTNNGVIYVKQTETEPVIKIRHGKDIVDKLLS